MPLIRPVLLVIVCALAGCGERPVVEVPTTHPANSDGAEAPMRTPSRTLDLSEAPAPTAATMPAHEDHQAADAHDAEHIHQEPVSKEGQQQAEPAGSGAGPAPKAPAEGGDEHGHDHHHAESAPSPTPGVAEGHPTEAGTKATYTCPMHAEVIKTEPGRCPICNMKLVAKKTGDHP